VILILFFTFQTDLFAPAMVIRFADYLYQEGDYHSALNEYRRYVFLSDSLEEKVYERIVDCLIKLKRFDEALKEVEKLGDTTKINYTKGVIYYTAGKYRKARECLFNIGMPYENDARRIIGFSYAQEFNFREAGKYLNLPPLKLRYKSPILGGIFSLFPGGGHFYCGRSEDGIFSFLVVGTCALLTNYYYHRGEDLKFGVSLGATILFYSANIYGGINAVRNYNYYQNEKYLKKIREENQ